MERVLIAGAPKSGTTALFYQIQQALPRNTNSSFEPSDLASLQNTYSAKNIISKIVLLKPPEIELINWFHKRVLIIRDPRDVLVSAFLYTAGYHSCWDEDNSSIKNYVELLRRKINCPGSISVYELWFQLCNKVFSLDEFFRRISFVMQFYKEIDCFPIHYEEFIEGKIVELSDYIGFNLKPNIDVPKVHGRVERTKSYGDWRNWFTKDDIEYFKPMMDPFLNRMNYNAEWNLNEVNKIDRQKSLDYFIKLINERRKASNLSLIESELL